jgi:hypothetical protein
MNRPLLRALRPLLAGTFLIASACASGPQAPAPVTGERDPDPAYPGRCSFMRLEAVERPSPARGVGPDNLGTGSLELVATYRPGGDSDDNDDDDDSQPLAYSFQVAQERVDDLRAHLQQNPVIVCRGRGESTGGEAVAPEPEGPSFEGQRGKPVAPGAEPGPQPQP